MDDIVARLRSEIDYDCKEEAADEIERLREQIQRDDEHYVAATAMSEKYRKLWVEESRKRKSMADEIADLTIRRKGYSL